MVEFRDGARFKKQLSVNDTNWGAEIKDAVVSPVFPSIYDGQIEFFPRFELTASNLTLKTGQVPMGNSYASTFYLLEFPTISTPSFGSADLESINLHLQAKDLNYNDNVTQQEIEVYKFKRTLPEQGIFPNNVISPPRNNNYLPQPERPMVAGGTYSTGPRIFESFDGFGSLIADSVVPSLYSGILPTTGSFDYFCTEDAYQVMNNAALYDNSDDGAWQKDGAIDWFKSKHDGNTIVVWVIINGDEIVPKRSSSHSGEGNTTDWWDSRFDSLMDDPNFKIYRWDWTQAVALGKTGSFVSQQLQRFSDATGSIKADDIDVNIAAELPKYALDRDNTFFDKIDYTHIRRDWSDIDPDTKRASITSVSTPYFSSEGSPSSGQCARFWNEIQSNDAAETYSENLRVFPDTDSVGYNSIRVIKQIPKPIPMARKSGATDQLDSMRVRMRVKIENMSKMHKTGDSLGGNTGDLPDLMTGNNLTRSLVVLLASRPPGDETLGRYLNRLNTGNPFDNYANGSTRRQFNNCRYKTPAGDPMAETSKYDIADTVICLDALNTQRQVFADIPVNVASQPPHNGLSRMNNYNGIAICKVPSGSSIDVKLADSAKTYGPVNSSTSDVIADSTAYNALAPEGNSHVAPTNSEAFNEGRFIMFHTGRSYGRFNHFDGMYQGYTNRSDTNVPDYTPFVVRPGVVHRRGEEYVLGGNGALNPVIADEFTVEGYTFTNGSLSVEGTSWDGRIVPGMMVTGDNVPYKENLGATVSYHWKDSGQVYLKIADYSGARGSGINDFVSGTTSLTFKGAITPMGPNPETFEYLNRDEEGIDLHESEWFFIDAYINHNDNPDAWLGDGGNLTGADGQQSTITWVISDSAERVLATKTQCHSGAGGKTKAKTTSAAGTSTTIPVTMVQKFNLGDCIAIDNDANSKTMERMLVTEIDGSTSKGHALYGTGNLTVKRGYQGDTIRSVADDKDIYHVPHSQSNMGDGFPGYLSIWVNNCRVGLQKRLTGLNEFRYGEAAGTDSSFWADASVPSTVDVLFDYISIESFQPGLSNVTKTPHQGSRGDLRLDGVGEDLILNLSNIAAGEPLVNAEHVDGDDDRLITPTYLAWGTNSDIWTNNTNHIFMGGRVSTSTIAFDPTDAAKRIMYDWGESNEESDIRFFTFPSQSTSIVNDTTVSDYTTSIMGFGLVRAGSFIPNRSNNLNGSYDPDKPTAARHAQSVNIGASTVYLASASVDDNRIDSFTKKGFFQVSGTSGLNFAADPTAADASANKIDGVFIKTLNPLVSTKITKILNANRGELEVADSSALKGFEDDEYIIYRLGYPWQHGGRGNVGGHYYRRGIYIKNLNTTKNKVILEKRPRGRDGMGTSVRTPYYSEYGSELLIDEYLSDLYISPLKYWLNCEIYNRDEENGELLPVTTYTHSVICDNTLNPYASTLGLTYSEFKYSDSVIDSSRWSLDLTTENSLVEVNVDYGFGSLSNSKETDTVDFESGVGYIQKQEIKLGENIFDLKGLVDKEKDRLLNTTEKVTFFIKASGETLGSGTIISTKYDEIGWEPSRVAPRLTYVYKDTLPTIQNFKVQPYKEDPFYPEYTWETSDDDLWYGFLMIDRESISHQYHKAALHIPLNEISTYTPLNSLGDGRDIFAYPYISGGEYTAGTRKRANTELSQNLTTSIEGLAGNCVIFDGNTIFLERQILAFDYPAPASKNLSVIAHFTVDSLSKITDQNDNKAYILQAPPTGTAGATPDCYSIWVDDSGIVNASVVTDDKTTEVILSSKYIVPVGTEEPVCVILTVDTELLVGNVKLFINGKLEDQSGKKTITGSSNNWKIDEEIEPLARTFYVGGQKKGSYLYNIFNGKIEEIVIYNHTIYPVVPTDGKLVLAKPLEEFTDSSDSAGKPIVVKLFIKDYHNIRGTTPEEVTQTSQISVRKAGLGLKTST